MNKSTGTHVASPEAYISINRNRIKQTNGNVYLDTNTEFEVEFFNKTSDIQKAVITINGKRQNDALVLRPGEHFYLDRFMDEKRRLKFDTYFVDDVKEVKDAIKNNGEIKIEFYKQQDTIQSWYTYTPPAYIRPYRPYWGSPAWGTTTANSGNITFTSNTADSFGAKGSGATQLRNASTRLDSIKASSVNNNQLFSQELAMASMESNKQIETGRVESGKSSDQDFTPVYYNFEYTANTTIVFKLYPTSAHGSMKTTDEVRNYCSDCGRRVKRGFQFCPGCGGRV